MKLLISILIFLHLISSPAPVKLPSLSPFPTPEVSNWYYPLKNFTSRSSLKSFGQYFSLASYIGKDAIFPNHFVGFHSGTDFEILPGEENSKVPVFAISSGQIIFKGQVMGFGGVLLEKLDQLNLTVLYGHLNLTLSFLKTGNQVSPGQQIAILGDAFSVQTGGERKHLHLGIYKGSGLYFRGYEPTLLDLNTHWVNPIDILKTNLAHD